MLLQLMGQDYLIRKYRKREIFMTQYVYIASPKRLPKGSFGSNFISLEQPNVFRNELDFIHLYFENNYGSKLKRRFSYSLHFSYSHQVAAYSNYIPLNLQLKGNSEEKKCLTILYAYLEEAIIKKLRELNSLSFFNVIYTREISCGNCVNYLVKCGVT